MSVFGKARWRGRNRYHHRTTRPFVELFEERMLLSGQIFTVNDPSDNGSNMNPTMHTLRWAVQQAEMPANSGSTIKFAITTGSSPWVISLNTAALLPISQPTTIDGTSQAGYSGTPLIVIDGSAISTDTGFDLTASQPSTIKGLDIVGFSGTGGIGISIDSDKNIIDLNDIGVDVPNLSPTISGNAVGISISGSKNVIGGSGAANTIGDNTSAGVAISGASAIGNVVSRNQYTGSNGMASPVQANDIGLTSGGNKNQPSPTLVAASYDSATNELLLQAWENSVAAPPQQTMEIYLDSTTPSQRTFLASVKVNLSNNQNTPMQVPVTISGLTSGENIVATLTDPTNGTSMFSAAQTITAPNIVTVTNDSGPGSLREAIDFANVPANENTKIDFQIPGAGPFTINLKSSALDPLTQPTTIDGTSQKGYSGTPVIVINGSGLAAGSTGLDLTADKSTIEGLDIVGFAATGGGAGGIGINVASNQNTVELNYIGVDVPNLSPTISGNAVGISISGNKNTVGGTTTSFANTIGDNTSAGVSISGAGATANVVSANYIGTDSKGDKLGNEIGVSVASASNTIGGTVAAAGNTIVESNSAGVSISGSGNLVAGDLIGIDSAGASLPNKVGVSINASNNTVGATATGIAANAIAGNTGAAVDVASGNTGVAIRQNLIYANGEGIVLEGTANDNQPAPSINDVSSVKNLTIVDYTVNPNTTITEAQTYIVDFFAAPSSAQGPAKVFLGTTTVTLSATSGPDFTAVFSNSTLSGAVPSSWIVPVGAGASTLIGNGLNGQMITATVTDASNNTSMFTTPATVATAPQSPFTVSNATDETSGKAVGSLRVVILESNFTPPSSGSTNTIKFAIPGTAPFVIDVGSTSLTPIALPTINVPTTIDGTSEPGILINGDGNSFDGLTLGGGSSKSTIEGLEILDFGGSGVVVQSSNDTIGGMTAVAGNIIGMNTTAGILIGTSPTSNTSSTTVQGDNIGDLPATLGTVTSVGNQLTIPVTITGIVGQTYTIYFYVGPPATGGELQFLGSFTMQSPLQTSMQTFTATFNVATLPQASQTITGYAAAPNGDGVQIMNAINDTIGGAASDVTDTTGANTIGFNLQHGVNVMSGVGNTLSRNFYTSNDGSAMTALVNDIANSNQTSPILGNPNPLGYDSKANTTQVRLSVSVPNTSLPVGLEFYLVGVNERVYLGATAPALLNGTKTITFTAQGDVTLGESIAATATTSNGTSSFSGSVTLTSALTVSNLSDDPAVSGSLPYAIAAANANPNPGTASVIVFAIPQSLANKDGTFTIQLKSTDKPLAITAPVTIDATTQFNYAGIPLVEIDGENSGVNDPFAGLTLGPYAQGTTVGSTITGLAIVGFGKAGIDIESDKNVVTSDLIGVVPVLGSTGQLNVNPGSPAPNQTGISINGSSNTIGGTTAGAGNTIAFNIGDAVDVITGNGNAIRDNPIYGNGEGIVLEDTVSQPQPTPSINHVSSVPNLTTVDFTVTPNNATGLTTTYHVDFFADSPFSFALPPSPPNRPAPLGPAYVFLGSTDVTVGGTTAQNFTALLTPSPQPLAVPGDWRIILAPAVMAGLSGQTITATATDSNDDTSAFATSTPTPTPNQSPFTVSNTTDDQAATAGSAVGSLRVALLNADFSPPPQSKGSATGSVTSQAYDPTTTQKTINYMATGMLGSMAGWTYTIDFFATGPGGTQQLVGSVPNSNLTGDAQSFLATIQIPSDQTVTSVAVVPDITFDITGTAPFVISPTLALPAITVPLTIDGTTESGVAINGAGQAFNGLTLSSGLNPVSNLPTTSSGSTIDGLAILDFNGIGIYVQSSNDTIGGTAAGAGNTIGLNTTAGILLATGTSSNAVEGNSIGVVPGSTPPQGEANGYGVQIINSDNNTIGGTAAGAANSVGFSTFEGVAVLSGKGNQVLRNIYTGTNGSSTYVPANDIAVSPGANNNPPALTLLGSALIGSDLYVTLDFSPTFTGSVSFDFYTDTSGSRTFLANTTPNPAGITTGPFTVVVPVSLPFSLSTEILATATFSGSVPSGTSGFSNEILSTSPTIVYTTADNPTPSVTIGGTTIPNAGIAGSLRFAINYANNHQNSSITFAIPGNGPLFIISLDSTTPQPATLMPLPPITASMTIDGTSQPGYATNKPVVEIDGTLLASGSGLDLRGGSSKIEGLIIANFKGAGAAGIAIESTSSSNTIQGNVIGTDTAGGKIGNTDGIDVSSPSNMITGNTVGFNSGAGIAIIADTDMASTSRNDVVGNYIGTDSSNRNLGNSKSGILISATDGVPGDPTAPTNPAAIQATVTGNNITANTIGFNAVANGQTPLYGGVEIEARQFNTSSAIAATGNVISGNMIGGVAGAVDSNGRYLAPTALGNKGPGILLVATGTKTNLSGNMIGGTATVTGSLPSAANEILDNASDGIEIDLRNDQSSANVANTIQGNLISLNFNGVHVIGDLTTVNSLGEIANNYIGTDPSGSFTFDPKGNPWGNVLSGVLVEQSGTGTPGSGTPPSESITGNVISGNGLSGVTVQRVSGARPEAFVRISGNILGLDKTGTQAIVYNSATGAALPMGNALDGVLLDNVVGVIVGSTLTSSVPATPSNVISGNLGRGVEIRGDSLASLSLPPESNVIQGNYIGTDISGTLAVQTVTTTTNPSVMTNDYTLGNLSDGVFLFVPAGTKIVDNLISNNRASGIHAAAQSGSQTTGPLMIEGNHIGTNAAGDSAADANKPKISLGNGADGVFLDSITSMVGATIGGLAGAANLISANRANGIDLLDSKWISIAGNLIGTDATGISSAVQVTDPVTNTPTLIVFGNSSNGILLNGSSNVSIGVVSIGGSAMAAGNVISGNLYSGILLANGATNNTISNNEIGTAVNGTGRLGNSADGIFLLAGAATIGGVVSNGGPVTLTTISDNIISGNSENGIQIFGPGASGNTVSNNNIGGSATMIGSARSVVTVPPGNGANGVYLNDDGGSNVVGPGNVISGNAQSGVLIFGTELKGGHDSVVGNKIGTDSTGSYPVPNGGNGVFIYGAPSNTIGGMAGTPGLGSKIGNLISGNAQAGVSIFSPADGAYADHNLVAGNLIGTDLKGNVAIPNRADGVDIYSARNNTIGNAAGGTGGLNVISGNQFNGVFIAKLSNVESTGNLINQNDIGTKADGMSVLPNGKDGVLVQNAYGNTIGVASSGVIRNVKAPTSPSNVISGNLASGIEFSDFAEDMPGNTVQGNFIGVSKDGTDSLGNAFAGVFVDNLGGFSSKEQIGGTGAGAGNIIGGSANGYGVDIVGPVTDGIPASNAVQGNLIGLDLNGNPVGNGIGVYLQNSWGNLIGGTVDARNVISANSNAGVELTGLFSTRNLIQNNEIGTTIDGMGRPGSTLSAASPTLDGTTPLQTYGVYITAPSPSFDTENKAPNNQVLNNLISGNMVGINITGVGSGLGTAQGVPFGRNIIAANMFGTDWSGNVANPNFEYGVYIDNSAANTVGGMGTGGNLLSANGVAGIEIVGGTPQTKAPPSKSGAPAARNMIIGNTIGYNRAGWPGFATAGGASVTVPDGPTVTLGRQLYGVVVIGSSSNIIGAKKQGNLIGGNFSTGVYITVQDFKGNIFSTPTNNTLNSNTIVNNGQYGVYRFESPRNSVAERPQRHANLFRGNPISLADFLKGVGVNTLPAPKSRYGSKAHPKRMKKAHPRPIKVTHNRPHKHHATRDGQPGLSTPGRPRIPVLFEPGVRTIQIEHLPARRHR